MASDKIVVLTGGNFEQEVINSALPVIVDFWASWCGPCRAVAPVMEELAAEFDGIIKVGKLNVDEQGELSSRFRIMSIPTIILFKNGQIAEKIIGARPKEEFSRIIAKNI
jgi:thioredoxin 1